MALDRDPRTGAATLVVLLDTPLGLIGIVSTFVIVLAGLSFLLIVLSVVAWRASSTLIYPAHRSAQQTPADYGLAAESVSFRSRDGITLRGWWIPADGNRHPDDVVDKRLPAKGTILLSHGYAGDCTPDLVYAPVLARAGYNVLLFDYRGHGASDGNFTSLVYFERRDLLAAMDLLRSRGIARVGLIGFSMGGAIALATAPLSPMVAGVISDSTFGELSQIIRNAALSRGAPPPLAALIGWVVEFVASVRLRANLFSADPIHWIARIAPRPVMIMHGAADHAVPVAEAQRLYRAAREPKELWIVPGADHRKIEDVVPQEYQERIVAFFDRVFNQITGERA